MTTINGLNISDNVNYLVEEINYRSAPQRDIITQPISTRPGDKFITSEWRTKVVSVKGRIFDTTASGLRDRVDTLQRNFAVQSTPLLVDTDRTYTVTLQKLEIPNQFFQNTMVEYTADFLASDPFSYGSALTISGTTISGTLTFSGMVTISGTVFAEPTLTLTPVNLTAAGLIGAGHSNIYQFKALYSSTNEYITISGINSNDIQYGVAMAIDYQNFLVTQSGVSIDYSGVFSRWEPGVRQFEITVVSGVRNSYKWIFSYQPRYYE